VADNGELFAAAPEETRERDLGLMEAVLFLENEGLDLETLALISGLAQERAAELLEELTERYGRPGSGLELSRVNGTILLSPKKEFWDLLKERYGKKNEAKLSKAAMETLAIVAYSQPITRSEIEAIRGVQADGMIRLLLERSLIREVGKKDVPGKPVQYGTTKDFLKFFQLGSIADLPRLSESERDRFEAD
jgi:segregation and condensation protein B